jgi:putative membrane protein
MHARLWRISRLGVVVLLIGLGSCEPRENKGAASGEVDHSTAADTAAQPATGGAMSDTGERLADPNIVALLDEANMADSAAGALAAKKATNAEVKAFAKLMMGEHHMLRAQGQQLAKRLNVTPQPPANDPVKALADQVTATLQSTPKGPEFDRVYIQNEVKVHQAVLDLAKKAHDQAQNEELKKLIEQAQPIIEKHLKLAQDLEQKLSGPSA